jgi:hypothetical protein
VLQCLHLQISHNNLGELHTIIIINILIVLQVHVNSPSITVLLSLIYEGLLMMPLDAWSSFHATSAAVQLNDRLTFSSGLFLTYCVSVTASYIRLNYFTYFIYCKGVTKLTCLIELHFLLISLLKNVSRTYSPKKIHNFGIFL